MSRTTIRSIIAISTLVALPLTAAPAMARQNPGPPVARSTASTASMTTTTTHRATTMLGGCRLERVGRQLVRCDDLTGNGVPAPAHIPEH